MIYFSTCHWCHVMEHESFEDEEVAEFMNENFIAIKVDREERPDIDSVYMTVCQAMTGSGGWPMTILMTPEQKPFWAGTYLPKDYKYGMPGLSDVLFSVAMEWKRNKEDLITSSNDILIKLKGFFNNKGNSSKIDNSILENCYIQLSRSYDIKYGGFGDAPKFPTPHKIMFLLRYYKIDKNPKTLKMAEKTLNAMYKGGIFDHIGFGFSRYSTDDRWLAPHFEKMLYDNALLVIAYLEAYEIAKNELYKNVAIKTLEYVCRELRDDNGGFYCAEDADSEGKEGKYYLFNPLEIIEVLGESNGKYFNDYFDITNSGNFEGKNIPNLINNKDFHKENERIEDLSKEVLNYRNTRMKLHRDDKILTSWNGLMIAALSKAYKVTENEIYLKYASEAVEFIYNNLIDKSGRLIARYRDNEARHKGYLDDYAFLTFGLIELYEATFEIKYLKKSICLTKDMINLFWDNENSGFYLYGNDGEHLIARPKELFDGAIPSGNSVAAYNLIKLGRITGDVSFDNIAEKQLNYISGGMISDELNYTFFLIAVYFALSKSQELVCLIKDHNDKEKIKRILGEKEMFNLTVIMKTEENTNEINELIPFIRDYDFLNNKATYYLCEGRSCLSPTNNIDDLKNKL